MSFHVGQIVLCVVQFVPLGHALVLPIKGRVYTVRGLTYSRSLALCGAPKLHGLFLEEIVNKPIATLDGLAEIAFQAEGFRPLDDSRLAVFRQHLAPITVREFT